MTRNKYQVKYPRGNKMRKNYWIKSYNRLPLWGKVALPAGIIILAAVLINTLFGAFKFILGIGLLAGLVYLAISAWNYVQIDQKKRNRF